MSKKAAGPARRRVLSLRYPTVLAKACARRDSLLRATRRWFLLPAAGVRIRYVLAFFILSSILYPPSSVLGADKSWSGQGDQTGWFDDANWLPAVAPTASDDAIVDFKDSSVNIPQSFHAQTLTIGGKKTSTVNVSNFTSGDVIPKNTTDIAVTNRRNGYLILKGSTGKITLKGAYKDSEEEIPEEPSFMVYVQ